MCIDTLVLKLQTTRVRVPEARLERLWLIIPALIIGIATGALEYKRRARPEDDGALKITVARSTCAAA